MDVDVYWDALRQGVWGVSEKGGTWDGAWPSGLAKSWVSVEVAIIISTALTGEVFCMGNAYCV